MAIWEKLNPRERLEAIGAGLIVLSFLFSIASYGVGSGTIALLGAIAVAAILYLKYAPNQKINWPAAPSLLIMGISAIVALLVLLDVLTSLRYLGLFGAVAVLALLCEAAGAALMAWGAWQEYQIEKPAMPNFGGSGTTGTASSTAPSAPSATSTPSAPPPATSPYDNRDDVPPA